MPYAMPQAEVTDITDIVPLKQMLQTYLACILPYTIRAGQDRLMSLSPTSGRCCGERGGG